MTMLAANMLVSASLLLLASFMITPAASAPSLRPDDGPTITDFCDPLDPESCTLPFPSDFYRREAVPECGDDSYCQLWLTSPTCFRSGLRCGVKVRVNLSHALPTDNLGKQVVSKELDELDGFRCVPLLDVGR